MEKVARPFSRPSKDQYSDRGVSHLEPGHLLEAALPSHPDLEPLLLPSESPSLGISDLQQSSTPHNTGGAGFVAPPPPSPLCHDRPPNTILELFASQAENIFLQEQANRWVDVHVAAACRRLRGVGPSTSWGGGGCRRQAAILFFLSSSPLSSLSLSLSLGCLVLFKVCIGKLLFNCFQSPALLKKLT